MGIESFIQEIFSSDSPPSKRSKGSSSFWSGLGNVARAVDKDLNKVFDKGLELDGKIIDKGFALGTQIVKGSQKTVNKIITESGKTVRSLGDDVEGTAEALSMPLLIGGAAVLFFLLKK